MSHTIPGDAVKRLALLATELPLAYIAYMLWLVVGGLMSGQMFLASEGFATVAGMPRCRPGA